MNLKKSQKKAVETIIHQYQLKKHKTICFKAPTGSGKTFIASNVISEIFNIEKQNNNQKTIIIIATLSDAELPKAFCKKINEYKKYLPFKHFEVEYRESPSIEKNNKRESVTPFILENNKVLIFGTSSFGKKKLFNVEGVLDNFLFEAKNEGWNLIYIRDEAHKGAVRANLSEEKEFKTFDQKLTNCSSFSIQMSATPNGDFPITELSPEELMNDGVYLLKNKAVINDFKNDLKNEKEVLLDAIKRFKEIKEKYKEIKEIYIRPAMLVQIDSKNKEQSEEEHNENIDNIIKIIESENLSYLLYTSNRKENNCKADRTLDEASKNNSLYDVIIFKVGAATGWDIPRACMLVQLRSVSSETLNLQTLGRIKRNPMPHLAFNKITDKYYLYSNYQERSRELKAYNLKNEFLDLKLYSGNLKIKKSLFIDKYIEKINNWFNNDNQIIVEEVKDIQQSKFLEYNYQNLEGILYSATINKKLASLFSLKIWLEKSIMNYHNLFPEKLLEEIKIIAKSKKIIYELLLFILFTRYINEIKKIYNESYENEKKWNQYQIIGGKKLLEFYQIWKDNDSKTIVDVSEWESYGYELIQPDQTKKQNVQYLDSSPEKEVIGKILDLIYTNKDKIKFIAKMPVLSSEIYFEYFDERDLNVHKSFMDFAIVDQEEKNILIIEIKGHKDYDPSKTSSMLYAYNQYMKSQKNDILLELALVYGGNKEEIDSSIRAHIWDKENNKAVTITLKQLISNFINK